ncbi:uncharacterized protein YALI1_A00911g [Yarrowia lipolytica]|uniref:Uncharacterized protein n=1 Tax=Yarrowia lipolytica TaxID=4952 RepID=A0A1D8N396_YARLL|nr:hypothetical protein YALI1_A00911g [Yarrowia lipolytica]
MSKKRRAKNDWGQVHREQVQIINSPKSASLFRFCPWAWKSCLIPFLRSVSMSRMSPEQYHSDSVAFLNIMSDIVDSLSLPTFI